MNRIGNHTQNIDSADRGMLALDSTVASSMSRHKG